MLRRFLLYLSRAKWAKNIVMNWGVARQVARRFVAGETEDDVIAALRAINTRGMTGSVDILGESTTDVAEAERYAESYIHLIERLPREKIKASVSLKLTALGLDVDANICQDHMRRILNVAQKHHICVTIDMEDHTYTDRTLALLRALRVEGYKNVQGVIQAYLYRSKDDVAALAKEGVDIRLCKGAYREPSEVAYPKKSDTDTAYVYEMKLLLDATSDGKGYPGIATHDDKIIDETRAYAAQLDLPHEKFEFQMLYGIHTDLQEKLISDGFRLRVYVPFGRQWYPYFLRRLAERPANLWFFMSNLVRWVRSK